MARTKAAAAAEWIHVDELVVWDDNPRHNEEAAWAVARSIEQFGFGAPIVAQRGTNRIIGGHTRRKAAVLLRDFYLDDQDWMERSEDLPWQVEGAPEPGMVPVRFLDVTDEQATRLALVDNKTSELATWDDEALKKILDELPHEDGWDLPGWGDDEIAKMFEGLSPEPEKPKKGKTKEVSFTVKEKDPSVAKLQIAFGAEHADKVLQVVREALDELELEYSLDME